MKAIKANVYVNNIGSCGFRRGLWTVTLENGATDTISASIPHAASLHDQESIIIARYNAIKQKESKQHEPT